MRGTPDSPGAEADAGSTQKKKTGKTLYWKVAQTLVWLVVTLSLVQLFLFAVAWRNVGDKTEQLLNQELAGNLATHLEPLLTPGGEYVRAQAVARFFLQANPRINIYVVDLRGAVRYNFSEEGETVIPADIDSIKRFLAVTEPSKEFPVYGRDPTNAGREVVFSAAPVSFADEQGYVYVVLFSSLYDRPATVFIEDTGGLLGVLSFLLALFLAIIVGLLLLHVITKPLRNLTAMVRDFQRGDFSSRWEVSVDDDVNRLGHAMNDMATAIVTRDEMRRELMANIFHDLRNPVAIASQYTELLSVQEGARSVPKLIEYCECIARNLQRLTRLLEELLELARLEANERRAKKTEFLLNRLAGELVMSFEPVAQNSGITLSLMAANERLSVVADESMIERILTNLLQNAFRYTPEGGRITIELKRSGGQVIVKVADTGCGIPESELPRVFERFYQGKDGAQKRHGIGGLGLAIVRKMVEAHGGEIEVASHEGQGTSFSFRLEAAE